MKKITLIESPTCPGPGYVSVTQEWVDKVEVLAAGLAETRGKINQGIAELSNELEYRRSLGEDI